VPLTSILSNRTNLLSAEVGAFRAAVVSEMHNSIDNQDVVWSAILLITPAISHNVATSVSPELPELDRGTPSTMCVKAVAFESVDRTGTWFTT
jgi:hypothetical protein